MYYTYIIDNNGVRGPRRRRARGGGRLPPLRAHPPEVGGRDESPPPAGRPDGTSCICPPVRPASTCIALSPSVQPRTSPSLALCPPFLPQCIAALYCNMETCIWRGTVSVG